MIPSKNQIQQHTFYIGNIFWFSLVKESQHNLWVKKTTQTPAPPKKTDIAQRYHLNSYSYKNNSKQLNIE